MFCKFKEKVSATRPGSVNSGLLCGFESIFLVVGLFVCGLLCCVRLLLVLFLIIIMKNNH